ncbi:replication endonuclease [Campylobacter ureolyticus]|uniref:replication endonuclease n=1 Tax=Campylobacter ureolyticus TaxID=827 RepID=UPI0022B48E9E|nr:replication endonuclease [Campylobacter ureolyticus]MCZ6157811.1 replication endonuclease [Campylobacter ureolyticus]MCZ6175069.1 replication endonuclease [Campylobacter ureolyticus]
MKTLYGISKIDILYAQNKLEKQKEFLKSNSFLSSSGEFRTLLDISMSANLSKNYYSEVTNRVNTISNISRDNGYIPIFLTVTLNGCFRDALKGDFSRFKSKDLRYIPYYYKENNTINKPFLTIKDLVHILNYQFNLFNSRFSSKFKCVDRYYIRVFEPHKKDGVPHIHCLFYAPKHTIDYLFQIYKDIFNAPQNLKQNSLTSEQIKNGEINGFQWSLHNPTGYVMKYITKTFLNLEKDEELDYLSSWYLKYKVRRILTSRTPIPLWVYRKINFIRGLRDFSTLSYLKLDEEDCVIEWSFEKDYIFISIPQTFEELIYEKGHLLYYKFGKLKAEYINQSKNYQRQRPKPTKPSKKDKIYHKAINRNMAMSQKELQHYHRYDNVKDKNYYTMSDFELMQEYFYATNPQSDFNNPLKLAILENEMLDRGLDNFTKNQEIHNLNNSDELYYDFIDQEKMFLDF